MDDTRDIAIEVRTKVERLEESVDKIERDMRRLMTIVDQGSGIIGVARLLGAGTIGGFLAMIIDNWQSLKNFFGK